MLIACWSPKGGSGTTVVSCALAALLARESGPAGGALLADLSGDAAAVLGVADSPGPGLAEWLAAGPDVGAGALARLETEVGAGLRLLAWKPPGPDFRPAPGRAEVAVEEAVARAVDAGLLARRVPRALERALRAVAGPHAGRDAA
jgi:hypothetical protein